MDGPDAVAFPCERASLNLDELFGADVPLEEWVTTVPGGRDDIRWTAIVYASGVIELHRGEGCSLEIPCQFPPTEEEWRALGWRCRK